MGLGLRAFAAVLCLLVTPSLAGRTKPLRGTPVTELLATAQQRGRIEVIVGVDDPAWQPEGRLTAAEIKKQRQRGHEKKHALVKRHPLTSFSSQNDLVSIPFFMARLSVGALRQLIEDDAVASLELDQLAEPALQQSTQTIGAVDAGLRQPVGFTGSGQKVVVIDFGVDHTHAFLGSRVLHEKAACFSTRHYDEQPGEAITDSGTWITSVCAGDVPSIEGSSEAVPFPGMPCVGEDAANPLRRCAHGTRVAGVVAGYQSPSLRGTATAAAIIPIQVGVKQTNSPSSEVAVWESSILHALDYVGRELHRSYAGNLVVNVSLAVKKYSASQCLPSSHPSMIAAIANLKSLKIPVVIASGNDGNKNWVAYPGCIAEAVTVSATTDADAVAAYANTSSVVDLFAPGGASIDPGNGIYTSSMCSGCTNPYIDDAGTSLAAPHVAGALAILREHSPAAGVDVLVDALKASGLLVTPPHESHDRKRINVNAAIDAIPSAQPPVLAPASVTLSDASHSSVSFNVSSTSLWSATTTDPWITILPDGYGNPPNGAYSDIVSYSVSRNNSPFQRAGMITVTSSAGTATFVVTQQGVPATYVRGDFNRDGKADLVWQNPSTSQNYLWYMNGTSLSEGKNMDSAGANWRVRAVHDLDGDGDSDIIWQNELTYQGYVWYMNGNQKVSESNMNNAGSGWLMVSSADFNQDGSPDLLWQNGSFQMYVWYLSGHDYVSGHNVNNAGPGWTAVGTGDFNGDGKPDIVWRNGAQTKLWFMNGTSNIGEAIVNAMVDSAWRTVSVADYSGDTKPDLLFQHEATGQLYVWFMDGATKIGESNVNSAGGGWVLVSPK